MKITVAPVLTHRELQILALLSNGLEYTQIGAQVGISVNGVRWHIKSVYRKLQVTNNVQAAKLYWEHRYAIIFHPALQVESFPSIWREKLVF